MAYKQIDEKFWKDNKTKKLSKDGCLFFLYLLTSPHTHYTGLFQIDLDYVNIDTPLKAKESKAAFKELIKFELIEYDKEHNLVWIKNMYKYHIKSAQHIKGAKTHISNLPRSILCKRLSELLSIPYRYPIDTPSIQVEVKEEVKEEVEVKEKVKDDSPFSDENGLSSLKNIDIPENLNKPIFFEAWREWQQFRKEKRQRLTPTSVKRQLKSLSKVGVEKAIRAIGMSIEKGWTGLFPDKVPNSKDSGFLDRLKGVDF